MDGVRWMRGDRGGTKGKDTEMRRGQRVSIVYVEAREEKGKRKEGGKPTDPDLDGRSFRDRIDSIVDDVSLHSS